MDEERYTERVVGLVTPTAAAALKQEAKDAGVSLSTRVRQIIQAHQAAQLEAARAERRDILAQAKREIGHPLMRDELSQQQQEPTQ